MRYSNVEFSVVYVDPSKSSSGDGTTPAKALKSLPSTAADFQNNTCYLIRRTAETLAAARPEILQMHGFFGDETQKLVLFDLIVDFSADAEAVRKEVCEKLIEKYPEYRFDIVLDSDYSD